MSDFAEKIGYDKSDLSKLVSASEVVETVLHVKDGNKKDGNIPTNNIPHISVLRSKTFHLSEISKAPKQAWLPLSQLLGDKANTVSKIKNYVKLIKQIVESVPEFMLPEDEENQDRYIGSLCEISIKNQLHCL